MSTFNSDTYDSYIKSRNYWQAANYLQDHLDIKHENANIVLDEIDRLKRQNDLQNAYLAKLEHEDREAYYFANALKDRGTIPISKRTSDGSYDPDNTNTLGDKYVSLINNLKVTDENNKGFGNKIDTIRIDLTDDGYNGLLKALEIDDINTNDLDISYRKKDGYHSIYIPTSSTSLYKVLKATDDMDKFWSNFWSKVGTDTALGFAVGETVGSAVPLLGNIAGFFVGGGAGLLTGIAEGLSYKKPFSIKGMSGNMAYGSDLFNSENLNEILKLGNNAIERDEKNNKQFEKTKYVQDIVATGYRGFTDMALDTYLAQNKISLDDYNKYKKELYDKYDRAMANMSLVKYEVYEMHNGSSDGTLEKVENSEDRLNLTKEILAAWDDNRLDQALAMCGGEYGMIFTIKDKKDTKSGEYSTTGNNQYRQIFVPGNFFNETDAEKLATSNPEYKAQRDASDVERYNYSKQLNDGNAVGYDGISYYYKEYNSKGGFTKTPIEKEQALSIFYRENIINDAARELLMYSINNNSSEADIMQRTIAVADAAVNSLYPETVYTNPRRKRERQSIIDAILKRLNSDDMQFPIVPNNAN